VVDAHLARAVANGRLLIVAGPPQGHRPAM
jgi:hypothetical protein